MQALQRLQTIPDATEYFDFSARRFVGNAKRTIRQVAAPEALKSWELWVAQALAALAKLHEAGFIHGAIDPSALIINEQNNLRLGGLQKVREANAPILVEPFAPNNLLLPPEQNLYAAFQSTVPFETAFKSLALSNWSQDQLETIFPRIQFSRPVMFGLYEKIQSVPLYSKMQQAGDVWMLGFALLTKYYEMLVWPYAITTEFYDTKHEAFHDLIESMVLINPSDRVGAIEALKVWAPQEVPKPSSAGVTTGVTTGVITALSSQASAIDEPIATDVESPSETIDAKIPSVTTGTAPTAATSALRRPYLALQSHPAGRNKTRRNLRNLGPNSATGNSAPPAAG